ncbi:hypothetical protein LX36DRAFT_657436 [Colletotrichum falcatum]|nr:hypothetical protein LX36DRAFT_657436 [Colletotrichum falcatum]
MQLSTLVTLLMPVALAQAAVWNIIGTCSNDLTCEVDNSIVNPTEPCGDKPGKFDGDGNAGKTSCTPPGTRCTYVWQC